MSVRSAVVVIVGVLVWASAAAGCATAPEPVAAGPSAATPATSGTASATTDPTGESLQIVPVGSTGLKVDGSITLGPPTAGATWTRSAAETLDLMQKSAGRVQPWLAMAHDVQLYLGSLSPEQAENLNSTDVVYLRLSGGTTCTANGMAGQTVEPTPVACTIGVLIRASDGSGLQTVEGAY